MIPGDLAAWLRAQGDLAARADIDLAGATDSTSPLRVRLQQVSERREVDQSGPSGARQTTLQIDLYGPTPRAARELAYEIEDLCQERLAGVVLDGSTVVDAIVTNVYQAGLSDAPPRGGNFQPGRWLMDLVITRHLV